jgi:NCS2 family nucleobase:cation symporter-2
LKKPASLDYGVADSPPLHLVVMSGVQHVALISIDLVFPLLVFRAADASLQAVTGLLAVGMIVLGIGSLLQASRFGPLGSGYMCPSSFTASYFAPSLLAVKFGGLPLVFGMTVFAGLVEAALSPLLNRLRAILPSEICGLVIFMIGLSAGIAGLRSLIGAQGAPVSTREWWVAGITLATMVGLNVWARGMARMLCALAGLVLGYLAAGAAGLVGARELAAVVDAPWIGLPDVRTVAWSFDVMLVIPFTIACVAAAMKAMGTITLCQRTNDAEWVRPDMRSITRGVLADGASTAIAGLAGSVGTNTCTSSVGLAAATGVAARKVAYATGAMLIALGFLPKLPAALAVMPRSVVVAALMFAVSFILINGLQVMSSRMLDARRTLVIGLSIVGGTAVEVFPIIAGAASKAMAPIVGSALVFSTTIALALNLLFRLGVRRTIGIDLDPSRWKPSDVEDVLIRQGGVWGARADVINRASWAICQVLEVVAENCWRTGTLVIEISFDEFSLDVTISYYGKLLEFPTHRPDEDEILGSDDGYAALPATCCATPRTGCAPSCGTGDLS